MLYYKDSLFWCFNVKCYLFHTKSEKTYVLPWIPINTHTLMHESQLFNKQLCMKFYYGFFFFIWDTAPVAMAQTQQNWAHFYLLFCDFCFTVFNKFHDFWPEDEGLGPSEHHQGGSQKIQHIIPTSFLWTKLRINPGLIIFSIKLKMKWLGIARQFKENEPVS